MNGKVSDQSMVSLGGQNVAGAYFMVFLGRS